MAERQPTTREFGIRQVVYGVTGAALYGIFSWLTNIFPLPAIDNVIFHPAVALLIFFGIAYGPWVGMLAGFIGNTLGDALSGWAYYWNWSLGVGLMGMIPGVMFSLRDFRARPNLIKAIGSGTAGIMFGMLFISLTEVFVDGIDINTALVSYFGPAFLGNFACTVVLLPILMLTLGGPVSKRNR